MGFPTDIADYGVDCPVGCWPAGKTPEIIYVSWSGILAGDDWLAAMRFPPDSFVALFQNTNVNWFRAFHPWIFNLTYNAAWTELEIAHTTYGQVFYAKVLTSCVMQFDNEIVNPVGNEWYAGEAQLGWNPIANTASMLNLMSLFNITPGPDTFCQFWRSDADTMVVLFARRIDSTSILIKFDYS